MARSRQYVRQMPKMYGNLYPEPKRSPGGFFRLLKRIWWGGIGVALLYALFFSASFAITHVEITGTTFTSEEAIKAQVPMGANIMRFSKEQMAQQILQEQTVASVAIFRGLPHSLKIVITERRPALRWVSGTTVTVVDEQGLPFLQYDVNAVPDPSTEIGKALAGVPSVTDTKALPVGQEVALTSVGFIQFINGLQDNLQHYLPEVQLDHLEIADSTSDLTYIAKSGLRVQFNTLGDPAVQVRNLTRLIHQKKATLTSKVDLRIDRWAYVTP